MSSRRSAVVQGAEQPVERALVVAPVPGLEGGLQVLVVRQPHTSHEPVRQEVARNVLQQVQRLVGVAALDQQPGQLAPGNRVARVDLECAAQRLLVAAQGKLIRLRGHERVEEPLHLGRRERSGELRGHLAVPEGLDRGNALDLERGREALVGVRVHLGQLDLPGARLGGTLERRRELAAGTAPLGPEVHDHGDLAGPLDHALLEARLVDVVDGGLNAH